MELDEKGSRCFPHDDGDDENHFLQTKQQKTVPEEWPAMNVKTLSALLGLIVPDGVGLGCSQGGQFERTSSRSLETTKDGDGLSPSRFKNVDVSTRRDDSAARLPLVSVPTPILKRLLLPRRRRRPQAKSSITRGALCGQWCL